MRTLRTRMLSFTLLCLAGPISAADVSEPAVEAAPPLSDTGTALPSDLSLSSLLDLDVDAAGFFPLDANRTPTTTYIIDQARLERLPVMTLADVIADVVPGMSMGRHGRSGQNVGTRGLLIDNSAKTLLLWDGQNLNQRTHFGFQAGYLLPLLGDLAGLEVVHGPSATVHGSGAINGIIGLQAQHGASRPGVWTRVSAGPMDELVTAEASVGGAPDADREWFLYAGGAVAGGVDTSDQTSVSRSGDHAREMDPSGRISGNGRLATAIGEWRIQGLAQRAAIDSGEVQANPIDEYWRHDLIAGRLGWSLALAPNTSVAVQLPVELHSYQVTNRAGFERGGAEQHGEINAVLRVGVTDHLRVALGGLGGIRRFEGGEGVFDGGPEASFQTMDGTWRENAVFGEIHGEAGPFLLIAGIRWDRYDAGTFTAHDDPVVTSDPSYDPDTMAAWSPRLALSYQPVEELVLRGSWQRGFRTPDVAYWLMLAWYNEGLNNGGLPLRPEVHEETMDSYELGLSYTAPDRSVALRLNSFWNQYHDTLYFRAYSQADVDAGILSQAELDNMQVTRGTGSPGHMINAPEDFSAIGGELSLSLRPTAWMGVEVSYGYTRPLGLDQADAAALRLSTADGDAWSRYPTHLIKADSTVLLGQQCDLTLGLRWQSAVEINPPTPLTAASFDDERTIVNLRVRWFGREGWQVAVTVQNLLSDDTMPVGDSNQYWNGKTGDDIARLYLHVGWEW